MNHYHGERYDMEWRAQELLAAIKPRLLAGMRDATEYARAQSMKLLNRGQPTAAAGRYRTMTQKNFGKVQPKGARGAYSRLSDRRVIQTRKTGSAKPRVSLQVDIATRKRSGRVYKTPDNAGYNRVGLDPSKPYEPPKKVTGRLFQSITAEAHQNDQRTWGTWGSNVVYARALELGYTGRDSRGFQRNLAPRPYLRPVMLRHKQEIQRLIFGHL